MDEGLARYRAASEANDIDGLMATVLALRLGPKVGRHPRGRPACAAEGVDSLGACSRSD